MCSGGGGDRNKRGCINMGRVLFLASPAPCSDVGVCATSGDPTRLDSRTGRTLRAFAPEADDDCPQLLWHPGIPYSRKWILCSPWLLPDSSETAFQQIPALLEATASSWLCRLARVVLCAGSFLFLFAFVANAQLAQAIN
ncbi:hypothetical protein AAFF_G00101210 [Aldrovandia affinis]|uniref:Uncharacterized protein n=1 Tax=Aldrovandia affinis TaxID=143900 RepID=A0AAD7RXE1_9TELE|nr:hypothetical protein AAFF_G00101210 [Aldrovandia affinis]